MVRSPKTPARLLSFCSFAAILWALAACGAGDDRGAAPEAKLTVAAQVDVGRELGLDASGSSDADGDIVAYRFVFGDGSAAVETAEPRVRHVFALTGLIEVRVHVRDAKGNIGEASAVVSVRVP